MSHRPFGVVCGVYQIENIENGHKYIGSSVDVRSRWNTHKSCLRRQVHINPILQNVWNKYGEDGLKFSVLLVCEREEALRYEQVFLDMLKPEYNIAKDAQAPALGKKLSEEHKRKIGLAQLGRKHTVESKRKMSLANKGREVSDKTRIKISEANTGKVRTEAFKELQHNNKTGLRHTEESKQKMSATRLGKPIAHEITDEHRQKLSQAKLGNTNGKSSWFKEGHKYQSHSINGGL